MDKRSEQILEILTRTGYASISELSRDLEVSDMTVRRCLDKLEQKAIIRRTRGGAVAGSGMIEVDYRVRVTVHRAQKQAIGRLAYSLIQPGELIFIDAGTTTAYLAAAMDRIRPITVVTNSAIVFQTLERLANIETIILGGTVNRLSHSVVGHFAEENLAAFRFSKAFLGTVGINLHEGFTQTNLDEVPVKKLAAANSKEVIILADSSKFNEQVLVRFLSLDQVQTVITDEQISPENLNILEKAGIKVLVAPLGGE